MSGACVMLLTAATPVTAPTAANWIENAARKAGLEFIAAGKLSSCVLEAVNNAIEHGYRGASGCVQIILHEAPGLIRVEIQDAGVGLPSQTPTQKPAAGSERGRGLWIMQQWCDEVQLESQPGRQRVVLTVYTAGASAAISNTEGV